MADPFNTGEDDVINALYAPRDDHAPTTPAPRRPNPQPPPPHHLDWRTALVAGVAGAVAGRLLDYFLEEYG